jgi:hypothetical protein
MQHVTPMDDHRDIKLHELQKRVAGGEYRIDPCTLADTIVSRRLSVAIASRPAPVASVARRERTRSPVSRVARARAAAGTPALAA